MKIEIILFRIIIVLMACYLNLSVISAVQADQPPNIVYILADDLGTGDLSCYNKGSKIQTPSIDQLASQGMRFTDAHTPSSVCTPTRYGVLTGRYAWRSRLKSGVTRGYSRSLIEPDRMTIASLLKQKGYNTACIGKWHLGLQAPDLDAKDHPPANIYIPEDHPHAVDYSKPLTPGPNSVGFDYFFGIPASLDMNPYVLIENDAVLEQPTEMTKRSLHRRKGGNGYWRDGKMAPSFRHVDVLPKITNKAVSWIGKQSAEKPFFLYFPLNAPHTPWVPSKKFKGQSQVGYYGDFVMQVDSVVSSILKALEDGDHSRNTLIILTSDNGSHWPVSDIKKWKHAANMLNRGQKADIWEGGHRVPFIASWPGQISPATKNHETICLTDLLATVAAIEDIPLPDNAGEDSFNILPLLLGKEIKNPIRTETIHHSIDGTFSIRSGPWKLIAGNLGSGGFSKPSQIKPKTNGIQGQLYNLTDDPSEKNNVWIKHPEKIKELSDRLKIIQEKGHSRY